MQLTSRKRKIKLLARLIIPTILLVFLQPLVFAQPASDNYQLQSYGFGAGGIFDASSGTYKMQGIAGEISGDQATSDSYKTGSGLIFTQQASLPPAPSWTNPGSTYNRLKLVIATGGNPPDAVYAVAITDNNWADTYYIQSDLTVGAVLGSEDWLDYTQWGASNGVYITNLRSSTEYKVKVKAGTGVYTESAWSAEATASTIEPSLTFAVSADTIKFDQLNSTNSWTDDAKNTILTTSTNAYNGYTVYAHETGPLTDNYANTIADYTSPNSNPTTWTGLGFGYTTSDSNLAGGTANRFTNEGPKYAGFTTNAPGDPMADNLGPIVEEPIIEDEHTITYRVTVDQTKPAGVYQNTIIYIVVPEY